jgi:hypothetical protein
MKDLANVVQGSASALKARMRDVLLQQRRLIDRALKELE